MEGNTVQNALSKNLVIDTAGFIRNAPLQEFGQNLITLNEVTDEIRDKETKQRLRCLPFELQFMSPDPGENCFWNLQLKIFEDSKGLIEKKNITVLRQDFTWPALELKQRLRCLPFELQFMSPDPGENTLKVLKPNFP